MSPPSGRTLRNRHTLPTVRAMVSWAARTISCARFATIAHEDDEVVVPRRMVTTTVVTIVVTTIPLMDERRRIAMVYSTIIMRLPGYLSRKARQPPKLTDCRSEPYLLHSLMTIKPFQQAFQLNPHHHLTTTHICTRV